MPNFWLLSAGKDGELWPAFWTKKKIAIGWSGLGNLGGLETRDQLNGLYRQTFAEDTPGQVRTAVTHTWNFYKGVNVGDVVFVRLYAHLIGIAVVAGDYEFLREGDPLRNTFYSPFFGEKFWHVRAVQWLSLGGGLKQPLTLTRLTLMPH